MKYKKNGIPKYFRKQKIMGAIMVLLGILTAVVAEGDITASLFIVPLGLYMCFTKEAVWMDDYYFEHMQRRKKP